MYNFSMLYTYAMFWMLFYSNQLQRKKCVLYDIDLFKKKEEKNRFHSVINWSVCVSKKYRERKKAGREIQQRQQQQQNIQIELKWTTDPMEECTILIAINSNTTLKLNAHTHSDARARAKNVILNSTILIADPKSI